MDTFSPLFDRRSDVSGPNFKFSTVLWPIMRANSPWENMDEESDTIFNDALLQYAEKLMDIRAELQSELDRWTPTTGAYTNSRAKYLKICHKPLDNNGIYALRFNWNANTLVVGYENGLVEAIDLKNEVPVTLKAAGNSSQALSSIKYHPVKRDQFYFTCVNGHIYTCHDSSDGNSYETKKIISEGSNETFAMDINMNGEKMITGGKDSRIRVYDLETSDISTCYRGFAMECKDSYTRLLEEDEEEGHYLNIYSIVCHPTNPSIFASAGLDSNIKIWDLRVRQFPVKNIYGPHVLGDAIDIQGNKVLSGQWASTEGLQVWDMGSCRLLNTFRPTNSSPQSFGQYFYCAKFIKGFNGLWSDDLVLAGGAGMGGLIVASISENVILAQFKDKGSILAVDNHNEIVAYGGTNHTLYISHFFPCGPDRSVTSALSALSVARHPVTTNESTTSMNLSNRL